MSCMKLFCTIGVWSNTLYQGQFWQQLILYPSQKPLKSESDLTHNILNRKKMFSYNYQLNAPLCHQQWSQFYLGSNFFAYGYPYYSQVDQSSPVDIKQIQQEEPDKKQQSSSAVIDILKEKVVQLKKKCRRTQNEIKRNKINNQLFTCNTNSPKAKRETIEQKDGRNANSNLLRMFFRRLISKKCNNLQIIIKIIKKYKLTISSSDFLRWVQEAKIDYRNYIRVPSVKKLFIGTTRVSEYAIILRILFKQFLDEESINCYLTSRKLKKQLMIINLKSIRVIFSEIFGQDNLQ